MSKKAKNSKKGKKGNYATHNYKKIKTFTNNTLVAFLFSITINENQRIQST
jgi:hypothetical protein